MAGEAQHASSEAQRSVGGAQRIVPEEQIVQRQRGLDLDVLHGTTDLEADVPLARHAEAGQLLELGEVHGGHAALDAQPAEGVEVERDTALRDGRVRGRAHAGVRELHAIREELHTGQDVTFRELEDGLRLAVRQPPGLTGEDEALALHVRLAVDAKRHQLSMQRALSGGGEVNPRARQSGLLQRGREVRPVRVDRQLQRDVPRELQLAGDVHAPGAGGDVHVVDLHLAIRRGQVGRESRAEVAHLEVARLARVPGHVGAHQLGAHERRLRLAGDRGPHQQLPAGLARHPHRLRQTAHGDEELRVHLQRGIAEVVQLAPQRDVEALQAYLRVGQIQLLLRRM